MFDNLKIGNRAEISLERDGTKINSYTTKLEIIESEKDLFLGFPVSAGQYVKLPKINDYDIVFFTDIGLYKFRAGVEKYVKIDGLPYIKVNLLDEGKKVQRREFFRYEYLRDFQFSKNSEELDYNKENIVPDDLENDDEVDFDLDFIFKTTYAAVSKDIGAGGIRFVTNEHLDRNEEIKIMYEINKEILIIDAKVLDRMDLNDQIYKYQTRCKFINITEEDKEKIISFIFNEQRKKLKVR